ncbi:MAG: UvrB/UvrC motif-containing protein [Planctomycetota bacterium]
MNNICQNCKKARATVHLTEIDPDSHEPHEMHLCEECARDSGGPQKKPVPLQEGTISFTTSIIGLGGAGPAAIGSRSAPSKIVCPECGMTNQEFRMKGRFGCLGCYGVFEENLLALLEKVHGATQYVGPAPKLVGEARRSAAAMEQELVDLRRRMKRLVKSEEYEEAARLRDQIDTLEKQLLESGDA